MRRTILPHCVSVYIALCLLCLSQRTFAQTTHSQVDAALAAASKSNATPEQIGAAVDGVFSLAGLDPSLAKAFSVRSRIVRSEVSFHQGTQPAISERQVGIALNRLVTRWSLPDYVLTSTNEIHKLHVALTSAFPVFLAGEVPQNTNTSSQKKQLGRSSMSPLEAHLLFALLVRQKLYTPEFQMTHEEYLRDWQLRHAGLSTQPYVDRSQNVAAAINHAAASASLRDLLAEADTTMDDLGLQGGSK